MQKGNFQIMWLLPLICLVIGAGSEPTDFDPFFGDGLSFFSPAEEGDYGTFSGLSFHPGGASLLNPEFKGSFASESADLPLYTEGKATPPQGTLSKLGRNYKDQLHWASANLRPNYPPPNIAGYGSSGSQQPSPGRIPRFRSEPFSSSSNVEERRHQSEQESSGKLFKNEAGPQSFVGGASSNSQPQIQTGFVPIFKGQGKRTQNPSILKDIPPPILTAESISATARPTVFKVSASVLSSASSRAPASLQAGPGNDSSSHEDLNRPRQAAYSRSLSTGDLKRVRVTSSESVVSRVVSSNQHKEPVPEESRLAAKKTLDINCEGSKDLGWCELGDKYPKKYVNQVVAACQDVIQRMYVEVPHNFEKLSDTSNFKAELNNSQKEARERGSHDAWSWASYFHEGSLCDSETGFLRPETAKDSTGKWNIIVQTDALRQRVPIEMCRKTNSSCKKMLECGGQKSQCLQKYNYHLLLSLNPTQKHDCPFMKLYRFPSACVCHVE